MAISSRPAGPAGAVPWHRRTETRDKAAAAAFLAPNLVLYTLFVLVPTVVGIVLGFFHWDLFGSPQWAGLENYRRLFSDSVMWHSLGRTALYLLFGVVPTVLLGFMLAVLVSTKMRGVAVVRTLFFVPMIVSSAVCSVLWAWLYQPSSGIINNILGWFGIDGPAWLVDTTWALPAITIMLIWMALPLVIMLYLAALQRIPENIYEAARLDGAGPWTRLWKITWPNVSGITALIFALQVVNFMGAPFEVSLMMTNGGPLESTQALSLYIYKVAFEQSDFGYASALSMLQFVMILIVGGGMRLVQRSRRG